MSSVLWANLLVDGNVSCDENDKYALYKHGKKLDKLTRKLGVSNFLSALDFTDLQFNLSHDALPANMESTDDLMALNGNWMAAQDAAEMLGNLLKHIKENEIKFGFFSDDREQVIRELGESLATADQAIRVNAMFNFSVVT